MSWWNSIHDLTGDISKGAEAVGKVGAWFGVGRIPLKFRRHHQFKLMGVETGKMDIERTIIKVDE